MLYALNLRESLRKVSPTADAYDMLGLSSVLLSFFRILTNWI